MSGVFRERMKFIVLLSGYEMKKGCWDNRTKLKYASEVPVFQEETERQCRF